LILFCNQFLKTVDISYDIDSEDFLLVGLDIFDLERFYLFDSDVLLDVVNLFIPVYDFLDQTDHLFDTLKVVFLLVNFGLLENSLCESVHKIDFKII
jgi:hypothetical protein